MIKQLATRQRVRKALLLSSMLLFPITMNYFSPYVIIAGASQGIINGSMLVFAGMFLSSLLFGRLWCGWVCPAGALGEVCFPINDQPVKGRKIDWIKWAIWFPWLGIIVWLAIAAGGYRSIDFFLDTQNGISVAGTADRPILIAYIIYFFVVGLFVLLSISIGRRAGCHTVCWMAPFMVLGRKLRNAGNWPSLRLQAQPELCSNCKKCTTSCPMSLDVNAMVQIGKMENTECILCGNCVDGCSKNAIHYSFSSNQGRI
jgi:polyferredoxin